MFSPFQFDLKLKSKIAIVANSKLKLLGRKSLFNVSKHLMHSHSVFAKSLYDQDEMPSISKVRLYSQSKGRQSH